MSDDCLVKKRKKSDQSIKDEDNSYMSFFFKDKSYLSILHR